MRLHFYHGYPLQLRLDYGPENISKEMVSWAKKHRVHIHYIQPGNQLRTRTQKDLIALTMKKY